MTGEEIVKDRQIKTDNVQVKYALWIRLWHTMNAAMFILAIVSGLNLQYASAGSPWGSFRLHILIHELSGKMLVISYVFFLVLNAKSGNVKHYAPQYKGLFQRLKLQLDYYLSGIFQRKPNPHNSDSKKFNPLQQISYLKMMYLLMPVIITTGTLMMFPGAISPKVFGISGYLLVALLHTATGFLASVFLPVHIYLSIIDNKTRIRDIFRLKR